MTASQTPVVPMRRSRPPGAIALLLWGAALMLSGIGIGAGGTLLLHRPPPPEQRPGEGHERPGGELDFRAGPIVDQMAHELELSGEQKKAVTAAYSDTLAAIKTLRGEMIVKLSVEHEKLRERLKQALTPLQFAQWDQRYAAARGQLMPDDPRGRRPPPPGGEGMGRPEGGPEGRGRPDGRGEVGRGPDGRLPMFNRPGDGPPEGGGPPPPPEGGPGPGGYPPPGPREDGPPPR